MLRRVLSRAGRRAAPPLQRRAMQCSSTAGAADGALHRSDGAAVPTWQRLRVADDDTHHVATASGAPLYAARYGAVLPFHPPGLAPARELHSDSWCFIDAAGAPVSERRFVRAFGFYEERAAVAVAPGKWLHVTTAVEPAYERTWGWCGNFCGGRAAVCTRGHGEDSGPPRYRHILPDGALLPADAPYAYAGDFREGFAAVRDARNGLCDHINAAGARMHRPGPLFDLDAFHKGFARARDAGGWFFISRATGAEAPLGGGGARFSALEPFYNGVALAQRADGERVLVVEPSDRAETLAAAAAAAAAPVPLDPSAPREEHEAALHDAFVAYWAPLAVRMGLDAGCADEQCGGGARRHAALLPQLRQAWRQLGLLRPDGRPTPRGELLRAGSVHRERAEYWLGDMLCRWVHVSGASGAAEGRPVPLFADARVQRVLDSYARQDWAGLLDVLPLPQPAPGARAAVADLGGGLGALLCAIKQRRPDLECVFVDLPLVVAQAQPACEAAGVSCIGTDLFGGVHGAPPLQLPVAELYIMSRVLHDWDDEAATRALRAVRAAAPHGARLCVVERVAGGADGGDAGLVSLHQGIVCGARERTADEWQRLFAAAGWAHEAGHQAWCAGHAVMRLVRDNSAMS